jgi:acetolactate decarboxylase
MNYLVIILIIITALSCGTSKTDDNNFKVVYKGALKTIMHKGDISAKADLLDFKETNHFYAIGAIENLKGEIQIFDSKPSNTSVVDDSLIFDNSFNKKATLLVYALVDNWNIIDIPESVSTYEQLEKFIEQAAKENRINIDEPFPFLIEGSAKSFDWHVINWKSDDKEHTHEKHKTSGLYGTIKDRQVEMLGFYSNAHHAIFTHHTTNMHIHVKTVDKKIAGHLDNLTLGKGMMLKLPEVNKHH